MQNTAELARLYRLALQEPTFDLTDLFQLQAKLLGSSTARELAAELLDGIRRSMGVRRGAVYLRQIDGEVFAPHAVFDAESDEEHTTLSQIPSLPEDHTIVAELEQAAAGQSLPFISSSALAGFAGEVFPAAAGDAEFVCYPLPGRSQLQGVLIVDVVGSRHSTEGISARMLLLSRHAGTVIDKIALLEESRSELERVQALLEKERQRQTEDRLGMLIGATPSMLRVFETIRTVAPLDVPVLIIGETGTGKELVARALHEGSERADRPFVSVNCAAVPSELVESELFGHEKGAFTGAQSRRAGKVDAARGGTLFLDEIAEMPENLQAKLLRFLQEHTFERVGGDELLEADVRILAATNRDVGDAVRENRIRRDLVYRLNTITISLPPLRDRVDDIPRLIEHFIEEANQRYGRSVKGMQPEVLARFLRYEWPGNVRELQNTVDRSVIFAQGEMLTSESVVRSSEPLAELAEDNRILTRVTPDTERSMTEMKREFVEQFERTYIGELLRLSDGNLSEAARLAKIDKKNFFEKMRRYGIDREQYLP